MKKNTYRIHLLSSIALLALSMLACQWGFVENTDNLSAVSQLLNQILPSSSEPQSKPKPTYAPLYAEPVSDKPIILSTQDQTLSTLYERVNPGVVAIWLITTQGIGQGTGFVVDTQGHIVTNYHVVENAEQVEVNFPSGLKTYGKIIARDPDSDLGIVKVDVQPEELHPLPLGDTKQTKIGQTVVAIGNPFGFDGTMTIGIISGKGRTLSSLRSTPSGDFFTSSDLIQTDAAINPGNSGGPLLNLQGEVIGVNRAIQTNSFNGQGEPVNSGIGFAIDINIVKRVLPALIAEGKYDYPYLGLEGLPELTLEAQKQLNLTRADGIYVTRVTANGPAQKAGIKTGDLIIAIDRNPLHSFGEMISYLFNNKSPGDTTTLTVIRSRKEEEFELTLDKRP